MSEGLYRLSVTLLGTPQLLVAGQPLERVRRKNRALIYYLAAQDKLPEAHGRGIGAEK